jgi:hypothetical protein
MPAKGTGKGPPRLAAPTIVAHDSPGKKTKAKPNKKAHVSPPIARPAKHQPVPVSPNFEFNEPELDMGELASIAKRIKLASSPKETTLKALKVCTYICITITKSTFPPLEGTFTAYYGASNTCCGR